MSYYDQLHPWVVYRLLPNCQNQALTRFRRRNDASIYLATLQRHMPFAKFIIAFDPPHPAPAEQMPIRAGGHAHVESSSGPGEILPAVQNFGQSR
ncbi:hypothetical protein ACQ4M4_13710 [Leptolyngbya sp. AN02str]|uniref:hypothetical protein n=1 Tax=Leptolyngbya sp. AN02str TaxID=3423363 RepID=UPI003D31D7E8